MYSTLGHTGCVTALVCSRRARQSERGESLKVVCFCFKPNALCTEHRLGHTSCILTALVCSRRARQSERPRRFLFFLEPL